MFLSIQTSSSYFLDMAKYLLDLTNSISAIVYQNVSGLRFLREDNRIALDFSKDSSLYGTG